MKSDIYLKWYSNNYWELYNHNHLALCYNSQIQYMKLFEKVDKHLLTENSLSLVLGYGNNNIINLLSNKVRGSSYIIATDPDLDCYTRFESIISYDIYKSSIYLDKFTSSFQDFYKKFKDNYQEKFSNIIVDTSELWVKQNKELFFKHCHSLLVKDGIMIIYTPKDKINPNTYNKYFNMIDCESCYISEWEEESSFIVLRK